MRLKLSISPVGMMLPAVALLCSVCLVAVAEAQLVIFQHVGQNDPITEGMELEIGGTPTAVAGNDGEDYWSIVSAKPDYCLYNRKMISWMGDANHDGSVNQVDAAILASNWLATSDVTWEHGDFNEDGTVNDIDATMLAINFGSTHFTGGFSDPSGWTATMRTRVVSGYHYSDTVFQWQDYAHSRLYAMGLSDGTGAYARGLWTIQNPALGSAYVHVGGDVNVSQYHTYQVVYDPVDATKISFYVDGLWFADMAMSAVNPSRWWQFDYLRWGDARVNTAATESHWSLVRFETGVAVIPEPSAWMLIILGGLGMLPFYRRR